MKSNVIIRMGAAYHDVTVKGSDGKPVRFNMRTMTKDEKRVFHREFMNAFRAGRK